MQYLKAAITIKYLMACYFFSRELSPPKCDFQCWLLFCSTRWKRKSSTNVCVSFDKKHLQKNVMMVLTYYLHANSKPTSNLANTKQMLSYHLNAIWELSMQATQ